MNEINSLPIQTIVIVSLIGLGLAALLILLLRFGKHIARAGLIIGVLVISTLIASSMLTQGAANLQQAKATADVARVAQTISLTQILLVGAGACLIGGLGSLALIGIGTAGLLYYRLQTKQDRQPPVQQSPALQWPEPEHQPSSYPFTTWCDDQPDLAQIDLTEWGW